MLNKYSVIYVPCKDKSEAARIARDLIGHKLAFCTNIIGSVHSVYRWEGKTEESDEAILIIKTGTGLVGKVSDSVNKLHSYKSPEIISWEIDKISKKTDNWLKKELFS